MNPINSSDNQTIFMTRPEGLARILSVDDAPGDLWTAQEMHSMWQHQLSAPIGVDLDTVTSVAATQLRNSPNLSAFRERSFAELLQHATPPIELLKLTKEFAKQTLKNAEEAHLKDLASALYYATYAAAVARYGESIGSMTEPELRPGFDWALKQPWLDDATRKLVSEARAKVGQQG